MKTRSKSRAECEADDDRNHAEMPEAVVNVIEAIEVDIIRGKLLPSVWLIEDHLMDDYGAKRHVVRAALAELNRLGVVVKQPHKGARVRRFDEATLSKLHNFRNILHITAIDAISFPIAEARFNRLQLAAQEHAQAVAMGDLILIHRSNMVFHRRFYGLCDNPYIIESIRLHDWISFPARAYGMSDTDALTIACEEHGAMVAAVRSEDRDLLRKLARQHTANARQLYEQKFLLRAREDVLKPSR